MGFTRAWTKYLRYTGHTWPSSQNVPHGFRLPVAPPCAAGTGSDLHHQVESSSARASHTDPGRLVTAPSPLVFLDRLDVPTPSRSMGPSASVGHSGHPKRPLQPLR